MRSMKVVAIGIWVFVNVTVLGLLVYIYLLWSVYWRAAAAANHSKLRTSIHKATPLRNNPPWQQWRGSGQSLFPGHPRYYVWNDTKFTPALPLDKLQRKVDTYKKQLVVKLRQSLLDSANILNVRSRATARNSYSVNYRGQRTESATKAVRSLVCGLGTGARARLLDPFAEPFAGLGLGALFPNDSASLLSSYGVYNTCAIVSSAGSLHKANLGREIDSHDAVVRFNNAPTDDFDADVGSKTTFRFVNSQVVSKPEFGFFSSPLYRNVTLLAWDPSNYTVDLHEWFRHPDFDLFEPYFRFRRKFPDQSFYILHPQFTWDVWDYLQRNTAAPIVRHPPSSGFLGIVVMLHLCHWVDVYEYIPSMRLTKRCHYYEVDEDVGCTFGDWHPLASEKLFALAVNSGTDVDVFANGVLKLRGIAEWNCADEELAGDR